MKFEVGDYFKLISIPKIRDKNTLVKVAYTKIATIEVHKKGKGLNIWEKFCVKYYGDKGKWRIEKGYVDTEENEEARYITTKITKEEFDLIWQEATILTGLQEIKV